MPARIIAGSRPERRPPGFPLRPFSAALLGAAMLTTTGCFDQITFPDTESDGRVTVSNDDEALASRLRYLDKDIELDPPNPAAFSAAFVGMVVSGPALAPTEISFNLNAELVPPTVNGQVVQATSISRRKSDKFLVSYNVRGASFLGGVDYITKATSRLPVVSSSVSFMDSDVSAVALDGRAIYAAQATDAAGFATPASLERLALDKERIQLQDNSRIDLSSFAATSVQEIGNYIYVTTGDEGGVFALDPSDMSIVGQFPLHDARWVEHDADNGRVVVVQGTPGQISVFEEGSFPAGSMTLLNTFDFAGATVPESKSAMDIAGGKAFIAAGAQGVQVMCLDDGAIVGSVPRPDPVALGLADDVVVTNAVTVDKDLMFISNGEAGVYVAAGDEEWKDTDCDEAQTINILGSLRFDDLQSVNHVDYRKDHLIIAAGTGGVKIVEIRTN